MRAATVQAEAEVAGGKLVIARSFRGSRLLLSVGLPRL